MPRSLSIVDYPITESELEFLRQLSLSGSRFMVVGMTAAILQGADSGTRDIDLWFRETSDGKLDHAARTVGGTFIWRANPPCLGGSELSRFDIVNHMSGLGAFDDEYPGAVECQIDDFIVKLLPIERIVDSKRASNRPKDKAAMPALSAALTSKRYL